MPALLAPLSLVATLAAAPAAEELLRRADAILAPEAFEADVTLTTHRANGESRSFSMHVWKKGTSHHRIRFVEPAEDRGKEVLRIGDDMWNYLPNLRRSVRISPKQEFHGGDFSNADVLRVNLAEDYSPTLAGSDGDAWVLELSAKSDAVAYDRIRYWVRKKDAMPLKQEFYTRSGKLVRRLELLEPRAYGRWVRPSRLVMWNLLVSTRRSELLVTNCEVRPGLEGGLFQLVALGR